MDKLFQKVTSIIITNYNSYWNNPIVNKYLGKEAIPNYEGTLILRKKGKPVWISHPFNYNQAKKEFWKKVIVEKYETKEDFEKITKKYCGKNIGYDSKFTSVSGLRNLKKMLKGKILVAVSKELEKEREIKTQKEIENIKIAVKETKKVITKARKKLKNRITEKEIENFVKNEFEKDGFETAFCIVAFGNNAKNLHHVPRNKRLSSGQVLFDIGAKYKGYVSDISESFWFGSVNGKEKKKFEEYDKKLFEIKVFLKKVEGKLKEGTKASDLWKAVEGLKMPHALGHGIGLEEHDFPSGIGQKSNWELKNGMVLAIELGEYKKFGIRIEKDYLITKMGFKEL